MEKPLLSVIFVILPPFILLTGPSALKGTWDTFQGNTFDYQTFASLEPIKKVY